MDLAINVISVVFFDFWYYTYICGIMRPFYFILQSRQMSNFALRYVLVMYDSAVMVLFIIAFIVLFSWMGQRIYMGTIEGAMHFKTLEDSLWSMLVCLTTSNFPDVMLPGYMAYRPYCILFLIYMVMGLFLFMSLVLAIFYSNFKIRFENKINKDELKRNIFLFKKFEEFGGSKGFLI